MDLPFLLCISSCASEVKTIEMTPQLETLYDFYDDDEKSSRGDERKLSVNLNDKRSEIIHSLLIVGLVVAVVFIVKLLSRCIQRRKAKSEFCMKVHFIIKGTLDVN